MRGALSKESRRKHGVYLIPNLLTTGNLFSGLYAILAVFNGDLQAAAVAVLIALVFDVLDGKSARLMNSTSQFGVEYDSLADLISFGVAPGLLIYGWALSDHGMLGAAVMFAFVACGALRLARFNVTKPGADSRFFTGLPIPAAASLVATFVIFDHHVIGHISADLKPVLVLIVSLTLAFLMVSNLKYRSFKELQFRGRHQFNYLVWAILVFMLVIAWPQLMLFVVFAAYVLSGMVERGVGLAFRAMGKRTGSGSSRSFSGAKE